MIQKMKYPNRDMLLAIALGDAYALALEYVSKKKRKDLLAEALKYERYLEHPTHGHKPGVYSDDTEMSVANAKVLIGADMPFTQALFADAWVREFIHGGKRKGYSRGFQSILESVNSGGELLSKIKGDSRKNGAAMRAVPFGVIPNPREMVDVVNMQSSITHDSPPAMFAAKLTALMSHYALYHGNPASSPDEAKAFYVQYLETDEMIHYAHVLESPFPDMEVRSHSRKRKDEFTMPVSIPTVWAVYDVIHRSMNLKDCMTKILVWGGDVDSVAAIAWGIASTHQSLDQLPDFFEQNLELGSKKTGTTTLRELGEQLMEKYV